MSLTVDFTNTSTGYIAAYLWDFGDGTLSPEVNPVHTFPIPGIYHVTLYVFGIYGGRDQIEHDVEVGGWTHFFDFTIDDGGFVPGSPALPRGVYDPGVGWRPDNTIHVSGDFLQIVNAPGVNFVIDAMEMIYTDNSPSPPNTLGGLFTILNVAPAKQNFTFSRGIRGVDLTFTAAFNVTITINKIGVSLAGTLADTVLTGLLVHSSVGVDPF